MGILNQPNEMTKFIMLYMILFFFGNANANSNEFRNYFRSSMETPMPHNDVDERLIKYLFVSNTTS